ncbi:o-succinylbenzoate--CoA ligase [Streptomyces triticagri]|uniref:O-succinylbenzoate--CoA ligase n=1 Tax=Streptomyces triticagri TaxID=2293568 RepID=A0A372LXF2_9ACTN|nr:AMP-binding protein [Streptomyces triticagri]RFU83219.1 o-succinylbenzoate--CoA ligase [Streptomyces triticagri]
MTFLPDDGFPLSEIPGAYATELGDTVVVRAGTETLTWTALHHGSNRLARGLLAAGTAAGDLVTLLLPNSTDLILAVFACYKAGVTPQVLSPRMTPAELDAILELGAPSVVVTEADGALGDRAGAVTVDSLGAGRSDGNLDARLAPSWKAPTSGGSTGRPKIILSGRPAVSSGFDSGMWGIEPGEQALITAPLHHNAPFVTALSAIFLGGSVTLLTRFDAERTLSAIDEYDVSWVYLVPTMMRRIMALPDEVRRQYSLATLRSVWHCAEPCPVWLKRKWIEWLGAERIWELYGGTEAEAGCTLRGDEWLEHVGSVGQVTWGEMKLVDPDGAEIVQPDVSGEVHMRVTPGTDATYRYIGAEPTVRDGWSSLGDMGRFDSDGYLYLLDRRSDMITVGGVNVYPAEIEAALVEHEQVLTAVVIGLPDPDTGNRLHAIVHTPQEAGVTADGVRAFLEGRLSPHKQPKSIELVHDSLRDAAGKVRRSELRARRMAAPTR